MSIVITPGHGRSAGEPDAVGRLAGSLLSVTVAGLSDPSRFRRGKSYLVERAVTRLDIRSGVLLATVVGGRPEPYLVTVTVETVSRPPGMTGRPDRSHIARLIPHAEELLCSCTCPDWDDPCKHAVAALLALAAEITARPELLIAWRCDDSDAPARATVGSRGRGERHLRLVPPAPPASPFESPEWRELLGEGVDIPRVDVAPASLSIPPITVDGADLAAVIRSAWETFARYAPDRSD